MIRVVADRRVLVVSGRVSEFAEVGQEVLVQGGRVVVEEVVGCTHPSHLLRGNPYRAHWTGGPGSVWVSDCACGGVAVVGPVGGARLLGRGSMATTVRG